MITCKYTYLAFLFNRKIRDHLFLSYNGYIRRKLSKNEVWFCLILRISYVILIPEPYYYVIEAIMRNLIYIIAIGLITVFLIFSIFRKDIKKPIRALSICGALIAVAAALFLWFNPSWSFPQTTGEYEVAVSESILIDESRIEPYENDGSFRSLNIGLWYPKNYTADNNTCPLIVFSHGSFGIKESNESLYRELASHGYVVCAIDHTYQCLDTVDADGKKVGIDGSYMNQVMGASDKDEKKREELVEFFSQWMKIRMDDMGFVLDTIFNSADKGDSAADGAYLLIDTKKIGVMGHSLGGAAALGMGRVRNDVDAVIALEAPFMYDVKGISDGDFVWNETAYPIPLLSVYSDSSWHILGSSPQYAGNFAILKDTSETTFDIYAKGAGHMTLTDLALSNPPLCLMFGQELFLDADAYTRKLNQTYLDFFDCYLKGNKAYNPAVF